MTTIPHNTTFATTQPSHKIASYPAHQAYEILRWTFVVIPIVAGIDKFTHLLVNWDMYLAPIINRMVLGYGHQFMLLGGVCEIMVGIAVYFWPRIMGYVIALWMLGIIINLLLVPGYYDIAARDLGLGLAGLALARLSADPNATMPAR